MRPSSILALALLLSLLASPALGAPDDDPRPIVSASEILAKIERGEPVEYDGVIVVGDLDLREVDLPTKHVERTEYEIEDMGLTEEVKMVESSINIELSEIRGDVKFDNAIFQNVVSFEDTNFTEYVMFPGTNFRGKDDRGRSVEFSNALFCGGYADFRGAVFSGGDADFEETVFSGGRANFKEAVFSGGIANFDEAIFSGGSADFEGAVFSGGDADFSKTVFSGGCANFEEAVFSGGIADFDEAIFSGASADFSGSVFSCGADFSGSVFSGDDAFFRKTVFSGGRFDFGRTTFDGDAEFGMAKFNNCGVYFWWVEFANEADFREVEFIECSAVFWRAEFNGHAYFRDAYFSICDADFREAYFSEITTFENSKFDNAYLRLDDAKIYILTFSNANFENGATISLAGTNYQRLYVHWDSIKNYLVYNGEAYLTLVKNFKNIEYFEDSDNCYYHYRRERQSMRSWLDAAKYIDILAWLTCGYGIRPGYTLGWSFVLISSFGIAFWTGNGIYKITMSNQNNANEKVEKEWCFSYICFTAINKISNILWRILAAPKMLRKLLGALLKLRLGTLRLLPGRMWNASFVTDVSLKDALYFSTMVFVSQPPHDWRPKEGWKYAVMLEDVLGWLLLALFLVTLGNVMIR